MTNAAQDGNARTPQPPNSFYKRNYCKYRFGAYRGCYTNCDEKSACKTLRKTVVVTREKD